MKHPNFAAYSEYYDFLYSDKDYKAESDYALGLIAAHSSSRSGSILELGCGTGAHAELFAEMGWSVHGIDLSPYMIERAYKRAEGSPQAAKLKFEQGDVRTFRRDECFDAVVSLFHVASYQTSNADLEGMFETAARHLKPGGIFLFDFWYGPAVLTERPAVRVKRFTNEQVSITRIAEPILEDHKNVVEVQYSISVRKGMEAHGEIFEKHRMRYLFLPELEAMLERHGFTLEGTTEWMSGRAVSLNSWSVCAMAKLGSLPGMTDN
jgi:SAM-dependent methyltransferase